MARYYYLGPWQQDADGTYMAPPRTVGLVDLRPVLPTAAYGFFATDALLPDSNYEPFGDGAGNRLEDVVLPAERRNRWASMLGMSPLQGGNRLIDALWETLTVQADPDGAVRAKPLMPCVDGMLELHLGGHSLIRRERASREHPAFAGIQQVIQAGYRQIRQDAQADKFGKSAKARNVYLRWLKCKAMELGLDDKAAQALLIPADLPKERPEKPQTPITDDFADPGTVPANWDILLGAASVSGGLLSMTVSPMTYLRHKSALTSSNHFTESTMATGTQRNLYVYARMQTQANAYRFGSGPNSFSSLQKTVGGSTTNLDTGSVTVVVGNRLRILANGSTIQGILYDAAGAVREVSDAISDSSLSDGLLVGLGREGAPGVCVVDDFLADSLAFPLAFPPVSGRRRGSLLRSNIVKGLP